MHFNFSFVQVDYSLGQSESQSKPLDIACPGTSVKWVKDVLDLLFCNHLAVIFYLYNDLLFTKMKRNVDVLSGRILTAVFRNILQSTV
jgi:hypothetical protein